MTGEYIINGKDFWTIYNVFVELGSEDFMSYPSRKDSLSVDFQDENGIDIDLAAPRFAAREFRLKCVLSASTRDEAKMKYGALFTELASAGTHNLYIADNDENYTVYYIRQENCSKISMLSSGYASLSFDLIFGETDPTVNVKPVYLVDHLDRFIIA